MRKETERLIIRSFEKKDAEAVLRLLSHPIVNCYVGEKIDTLDEAYRHISESNPEYDLAACLKDTDVFIGTLFGRKNGEDTYSPCWNFLPEYCGFGYATEAARAYFDYLFCEKKMRRLYAYTEDDNIASQNVCRKLGMRHEGSFMEFISFVNNLDGTPKYENTLQFAILKKEWRADG
jgi:[ribosomal protein S5]-alanine N-acetyltransferase